MSHFAFLGTTQLSIGSPAKASEAEGDVGLASAVFRVVVRALILGVVVLIVLNSMSWMRQGKENVPSIAIPCSLLNVSELRLITFDLFGALMLTKSSLNDTIAQLLPTLAVSDVENFTAEWLLAYQSFFGQTFPPALTHQPFLWVIRSSLLKILNTFNLSSTVPESSSTFKSLLSAWGNLQPRDGAIEVLSRLGQKYQLAVLSNGDRGTLQQALHVFLPAVNISLILPSDYPVNCFKACSGMYAQALAAVDGDQRRVLHVAGSSYDANGARTFGIFAGVLGSSVANDDPAPCFVFDSIKKLPSFFGMK